MGFQHGELLGFRLLADSKRRRGADQDHPHRAPGQKSVKFGKPQARLSTVNEIYIWSLIE